MQNFFNINFIKTPEHLLPSIADSLKSPNEAVVQQSFNSILHEQLNNAASDPGEEKNALRDIHKNPIEERIPEQQAAKSIFINQPAAENKNDIRDNNIHISKNEKEKQHIDNNEIVAGSAKKSDAGGAGRKDKIQKNAQDNAVKSKDTVKDNTSHAVDVSQLLKDLSFILDMLKGLSLDKKQTHEVKSTLAELKNTMGSRNNLLAKNEGREAATIGSELKRLVERLKVLLGAANERIGLKGRGAYHGDISRSKDMENKDNKIEPSELANLKKQISKLADEIRQHLNNKKQESITAKGDEFVSENKNSGNQKATLAGASTSDKTEVLQTKDNATNNFSFSFYRKEAESAGSTGQKDSLSAARKNNAFSEQMNDIVQNARIVVRDSKNGSFSIKLYPESLGRVNVNLNLEHGVIFGKFLVDNDAAKETLIENMYYVRERLQESGISVGEFQVNVRDENNSFSGAGKEDSSHNIGKSHSALAGMEYESNSLYMHNGEIDLII